MSSLPLELLAPLEFVAQLAPPYNQLHTPAPGIGAMVALVLFIAASVWLGTVAQKVVERSAFIQGYFQGNRGLGAWTIALTATVQSGGTFMGFPSLVYTSGWIVALWIASYMIVPITGFGLIGKRIAQISRRTGAVTMPDLFRARFASPTAGLVTSLLIILFMSIMMIAQFKAGAVVMKIAWPGSGQLAISESQAQVDWIYLIGLAVFSLTVVGYTLIGGFLAAVWTDLLQSIMMIVGVTILVCLAIPAAGGLENASRRAISNVEQLARNQGATPAAAAQAGIQYASGPGLRGDGVTPYLPLAMAFSFFCFWPFAGTASPASVVRIMACKDTGVLRRSIFLLAVYNMGIYLPLIAICICAKALMPNLGGKSDEVIPRMALALTSEFPLGSGGWVSGIILAAPFGAIMATVSSYLLVIASGLVRDVYQRFIHPHATDHEMRRLTYVVMAAIGIIAAAMNIFPVKHLQMLVVFSSGCAASSFLIPTVMMCYWRRATATGTIAAMLAGAAASLTLNLIGLFQAFAKTGQFANFTPYYLLQFEPIVWGLLVSLVVGIGVSLITRPPDEATVSKLFDAPQAKPDQVG
ncbi:MAG: sodium:solute symporter [Planctomycetaceae bacterium]|nr:sodium:solute symporter [Planctomycetaceae bacterium]